MRKSHVAIIAGLLMLPTQAAARGFFEAPGRFGSVGQAQNLCSNQLWNNPFSALQAIPCFAPGNDM
jgi:hypothetical protein